MEEELTKDKKKIDVCNEILEWIFCLTVAVVIYLLINYFLGTVSGIKQTSMTPTYVEGEKILIKRPVIFKQELHYGDVITFISPDAVPDIVESEDDISNEILKDVKATASYMERNLFSKFLQEFIGIDKKSYIKRIIGLPGDEIEVLPNGSVKRNGTILDEPYLKDGITSRNGIYVHVIVPENTVYVMGDNRLGSLDSRALGCIPLEKIDGYVIAKVWPFSKFECYK